MPTRVGGKSADDLDTRWALINEDGDIEAQSGGFTVVDCYTTNANCYIDIGEDATDNGITGLRRDQQHRRLDDPVGTDRRRCLRPDHDRLRTAEHGSGERDRCRSA